MNQPPPVERKQPEGPLALLDMLVSPAVKVIKGFFEKLPFKLQVTIGTLIIVILVGVWIAGTVRFGGAGSEPPSGQMGRPVNPPPQPINPARTDATNPCPLAGIKILSPKAEALFGPHDKIDGWIEKLPAGFRMFVAFCCEDTNNMIYSVGPVTEIKSGAWSRIVPKPCADHEAGNHVRLLAMLASEGTDPKTYDVRDDPGVESLPDGVYECANVRVVRKKSPGN